MLHRHKDMTIWQMAKVSWNNIDSSAKLILKIYASFAIALACVFIALVTAFIHFGSKVPMDEAIAAGRENSCMSNQLKNRDPRESLTRLDLRIIRKGCESAEFNEALKNRL